MTRYIARRLFYSIFVLVGVSVVVFLTLQLIPGDPVIALAGENASPQVIEQIRTELGLDQPVPVQYLRWLERLLHGSLGTSIRTHREVIVEICDRLPYTMVLALSAVLLSTTLGILMGVLAAIHHGRLGDYLTMGFAIVGLSVPNFWIALLMIMFFALYLHVLPVMGAASWQNLIMPAVALSLHTAAQEARVTRASMLEVLGQDYIRTARAKGLAERTTIFRHALKNALIPVTTMIGIQFGQLMGGAVIMESIFAWPGIGRLALQSVLGRDFPVIQGTVLFVAVIFLLSNLVVDILYASLDPRIRYN